MECYHTTRPRCRMHTEHQSYGVPPHYKQQWSMGNPMAAREAREARYGALVAHVARALYIRLNYNSTTKIMFRRVSNRDRHALEIELILLCARETLCNKEGNAKSAKFAECRCAQICRLEWGFKRVGRDSHKFFIRRDAGKDSKNPFTDAAAQEFTPYNNFEDFSATCICTSSMQ